MRWNVRHRKEAREYEKRWRIKNPEKHKAIRDRRYKKLKEETILAYGNKCGCCGEKELSFLTLDHSNNDGRNNKWGSGRGNAHYSWLRARKFPKNLGLRVYCFNCNCGRRHGICPHQKQK